MGIFFVYLWQHETEFIPFFAKQIMASYQTIAKTRLSVLQLHQEYFHPEPEAFSGAFRS